MAEEHKIAVGEGVQVKHGGIAMTVIQIDGTDAVCLWMSGDKKCVERFPLVALEWIDPNRSIL